MLIKKISNKRLSRNLKTKKTPLLVLPLATFQIRHRVKQNIKKQKIKENKIKAYSSKSIQCTVEKITRGTGKSEKRSGRKRPITIKPFLRHHFAMNAFRWILLLICVYLVVGTIVVMIQDGTESLKSIVIFSIMGFFTFFMGYLGWILACDVLLIVSGKKNPRNEVDLET